MKKLLQFIFYKVYHFYKGRSGKEDPEDLAGPFLCLWILTTIGFSIFLLLIILDYQFVLEWFEGKKEYLLTIPGIIIFIIAWRVLMSNEGYKEWIKPELFEDTIYAGKWSNVIFWGLFLFPFAMLILAKVLY